jgi:hypothetical protein
VPVALWALKDNSTGNRQEAAGSRQQAAVLVENGHVVNWNQVIQLLTLIVTVATAIVAAIAKNNVLGKVDRMASVVSKMDDSTNKSWLIEYNYDRLLRLSLMQRAPRSGPTRALTYGLLGLGLVALVLAIAGITLDATNLFFWISYGVWILAWLGAVLLDDTSKHLQNEWIKQEVSQRGLVLLDPATKVTS